MTSETPPECRSDYFQDTGATRHFGGRSIRCSLRKGHPGNHQEMYDEGVANEWAPKVEPPAPPRSWSRPPEPGPEVTAVTDKYGRRWLHERERWCHVDEDDAHHHDDWSHVLVNFGPLVDASSPTPIPQEDTQ